MDPAHALDGFLAAFGANSINFALAAPDGRIKTYDTVSGRLRSTLSTGLGAAKPGAADGHLVEGQQCLTWVDSQELSAEAAGGSSSGAGPAHSWVAIGTSAGSVKLYDSATGELQWAVDRTNEGGVACLAHSTRSGGLLYASGPDGVAFSLDPATGSTRSKFKGSKHGASAAALSADGGQLLLGGSTLTVWELSDQQRVARLAGHPLPVRAVAFSPDKRCVLSAAEGERLVAVWVLGGGKRSAAVAAASLAVSQPVVQLTTTAASAEQPAGSFYAAGTTQGGEAYVWLMRPLPGAALDVQQVARLAVDPRHAAREVVFGVALEPAPGGATVVAAVGTAAKPRFERVQVGTTPLPSSSRSNGSHLTFLQPPPAGESLIQPGAAAAAGGSGRAAAPEVLGPDNAGQLVQQRVGSRQGRKRSEPEPADGAGAGGGSSSDEEGDDDGMEGVDEEEGQAAGGEATLGQRVQQLERQQQHARDDEQQQQGQQPAAAAAAAAAARGDGGAAVELPAGPLKADSLAVLLSQALRSSDKALLERCLAVGRERVVVNTVKRLVPMDAALLLRAAVERLQSKPKRGAQLAAWIQAVLLHHTAYLMAAPAAAPLMSSLYQIIEARLSMQRQLLSLTGRLDLLLAQRGPDGAAGGGGGSAAAAVAQVSYQESDSEAEVEIVDAAGGGGDASDDYSTDDGDEDGESDDELGSGSSDDDVGGSSDDDSDGDEDEAGDMEEDEE